MILSLAPWIGLLIASAVMFGCAASARQRPLETGDAAPDFEATDHKGTKLSLSGLTADGPLVLSLLRGFS